MEFVNIVYDKQMLKLQKPHNKLHYKLFGCKWCSNKSSKKCAEVVVRNVPGKIVTQTLLNSKNSLRDQIKSMLVI